MSRRRTESRQLAVARSAPLRVDWLGVVPYGAALARQRDAVEERRGGGPDRLLLLEHPPVITLGRSARPENLRVPREALSERGVEVCDVARGGDVTWHGPGQLVGYAIVDLAARGVPDVERWLRTIEGALIGALGALGLGGRQVPGRTGVFLERPDGDGRARKIASIGVGLRGWITWHGFALNVTTAPGAFDAIVPCGLHDVAMTSVAEALGAEPTPALFERTRAEVAAAFTGALA